MQERVHMEPTNTVLLRHFSKCGVGLPVPSLVLDVNLCACALVSLQQNDNSNHSGWSAARLEAETRSDMRPGVGPSTSSGFGDAPKSSPSSKNATDQSIGSAMLLSVSCLKGQYRATTREQYWYISVPDGVSGPQRWPTFVVMREP